MWSSMEIPLILNFHLDFKFYNFFRFMVVRHPFERLLSAYRDKLEDLSRDLQARDGYYYTMYGKHIVAEYRDKADSNLTGIIEPTWKEFITYILNTPATKYDEHWMPIWMLCSPCIIRYDAVSKMETFSEDTQFILQQAGLEDKLSVELVFSQNKFAYEKKYNGILFV